MTGEPVIEDATPLPPTPAEELGPGLGEAVDVPPTAPAPPPPPPPAQTPVVCDAPPPLFP